MKYEITIGAERVGSTPEPDYAKACQRCGAMLSSGARWKKAEDGLHLCRDCRESADTYWRDMARGEAEFRWTTDEELAALDACEFLGPAPLSGRKDWTCKTHEVVALPKDPVKHAHRRPGKRGDVYCPLQTTNIEERRAS